MRGRAAGDGGPSAFSAYIYCMGFEFAETMAGTMELESDRGVRYPFRFEITAHAESTRRHFRDGKADISGVIYAPPIAEGAPVTGVITIRPIGQRIIRYELSFVGDDGAPLQM